MLNDAAFIGLDQMRRSSSRAMPRMCSCGKISEARTKDYVELMEILRSGPDRPFDDVATIDPPGALPPLPQSDASTSINGWVAAEPLDAPYSAGLCSSCGSTLASICSSPGREGGVASAQTSGGAAGDAKTGGGAEEEACQVSYTQVRSAAAANVQPTSIGGFVGNVDQHRGTGLGGVAPGVVEVAGSGVRRLTPSVGGTTLGVARVVPGVGSTGVSEVAQGAGGLHLVGGRWSRV